MTLPAGAATGPWLGPPLVRPELRVPGHALVVALPPRDAPDDVVQEWVAHQPGLVQHAEALAQLVHAMAATERQLGDVAAFLMYGDSGGVLSGGAAVLSLELVDPMSGSPSVRARRITGLLRGIAREIGHPDGTTEIQHRATGGRAAAVRLRFLSSMPAVGDETEAALVEVCRWLYPVPRHRDLAWSLCFQTLDLDRADELVAEFDAMAGSLRWARTGPA